MVERDYFGDDNEVTMTDCQYEDNYSGNGGGVCFDDDCIFNVTGSRFENNDAGSNGGGVFGRRNFIADINDCDFIGNHGGETYGPEGAGQDWKTAEGSPQEGAS